MKWRRALAPAALLALTSAVPVLAAGPNLEAVRLQERDVPSDFHAGHTRVYTHFSTKMSVPLVAGGMTSAATCLLPGAARSWGWTRGLVQGFDAPKFGDVLQVCASQFSSVHGAHLLYAQQVKKDINPYIRLKMDKPMSGAGVGDEATGMLALTPGCSCSPALTHAAYDIVFRHGDVVVSVVYSGASSFTATQFRSLVTRTNARLH